MNDTSSKPCYLYEITHIESGKVYVGITINPKRRWNRHKNPGSRCIYLRNAIQKYKPSAFRFEVIAEFTSFANALVDEAKIIRFYWLIGIVLYNMTDGGGGATGFLHSEETKNKLKHKMRGRKLSKETKQKMRDAQKLRPPASNKTKQKISKSLKGYKHSEESKANMSKAHKGQRLSEATRQKLSEVHMGHKHSEETKKKIGAAHKGRVFSSESIEKMRMAALHRKQRERDDKGKWIKSKEYTNENTHYRI